MDDGESRARALSRYLEQARARRGQAEYAIPVRERDVEVEATGGQQQLWLHSELASGSPIYNEPVTIHFPVTDLRPLPERHRESRAVQLATEDAKLPFDLTRPPLIRVQLIRLAEREYRLFLTLHHIIFDAYSLYRIFLPELQACYAGFLNGTDPGLQALGVQYPDYALWLKRVYSTRASEPHLCYWEAQLSGHLPVLNLPFD